MCGRFAQGLIEDEVMDFFELSKIVNFPPYQPKYNGAPTQNFILCRHNESEHRSLASLTWGLVPFWAKERSIGTRLINARSETVDKKPSFRNAFRCRRCLVPANGWFEWQRKDGNTQPYYIQLTGGLLMAFAGIWETWVGEDGTLETFSILTRDAITKLKSIHHRQPILVEQDCFDTWLDADSSKEDLNKVILANPPEFEAWPVSNLVNNARNNVSEVMVPI